MPTDRANSQYGLLKYSTKNVGDEIQSIAARQFLPRIDYLVDRDYLDEFNPEESLPPVKFILNGWFAHRAKSWPPSDHVDPLLVSMHIDAKDETVRRAFLSSESRALLESKQPIGARDLYTLDFLERNGIDSYHSGCMTLTLTRDERIPKQDFIVLLDAGEQVEDAVRAATNRPIVMASALTRGDLDASTRFHLAEMFLTLFQSAHLVVTTRLHAMLPSLALGTPVAFIDRPGIYKPERLSGLKELIRSFGSPAQFAAMPDLRSYLETPPANKTDHLALRSTIAARAENFTGYRATSFLGDRPLPTGADKVELLTLMIECLRSDSELGGLREGRGVIFNHLKSRVAERVR